MQDTETPTDTEISTDADDANNAPDDNQNTDDGIHQEIQKQDDISYKKWVYTGCISVVALLLLLFIITFGDL